MQTKIARVLVVRELEYDTECGVGAPHDLKFELSSCPAFKELTSKMCHV
jgi:hypothetical protein